jgi:glycolate oxidase FAD binding subunit
MTQNYHPSTPAELADMVHQACDSKTPVTAWGGGTHQAIGNAIQPEGVIIHTRKLNRVLIYEPRDMTISIEAGTTLAELDAVIRPHGQMLPMDVPLPSQCTVGGAIAVAADGARRLGYGTFRDVLLGVNVVEASGRMSKSGGMTVKNVSGYDMMKLYHGSFGTLGLLTSVNLKLIPRPRAVATLRVNFNDMASAFGMIDRVHEGQLLPVAAELICDNHIGLNQPDQQTIEVAFQTDGLPEAVERHLRDLETLAKASHATASRTLRTNEHDSFWAYVADLPQLTQLPTDKMALKLSCLPSALGAAMQTAQTLAARLGLRFSANARSLNGVAYIRVRGNTAALIAYHGALLVQHPHLVILAAPPEVKTTCKVWGNAFNGLEIMQNIKREFDPHGLLNRNRFVV